MLSFSFPFILFIMPNLMDMKWYLIMFLICIPLMTSDIEYFFMSLLAICIVFEEMSIFELGNI